MCELTCRWGHIMNGFKECPECGGKAAYFDGKSNRQLAEEDRNGYAMHEREEEEVDIDEGEEE